MKILIIGSGGREHALAWKCVQSPLASEVLVAPGNAGTANETGCRNVAVAAEDIEGLIQLAESEQVELTIVGPEAPLVAGIVDQFKAKGLKCFGPTAAAAQLEGSKAYTKSFCEKHQIPTAASATFEQLEPALAYVRQRGAPIVVKADGLAAGKGVVVATSVAQAEAALRDMLEDSRFGNAGSRVVVEEFLRGEEASFIAIVSGQDIVPLASSQDHKARDDGDTGPNTGGMGAYSPAPVVDQAMHQRILDQVMLPTVRGIAADAEPFIGFLYAGVMIDSDGIPKVLEFNVRFGDPETQPVMMRMRSDLVSLCLAAVDGQLDGIGVDWDPRPALGVVMAAGGYPESYAKGLAISGLSDSEPDGVKTFHAGTALSDGQVVTSGGRVLCVTALGDSVAEAKSRAYQRAAQIEWEGAFYRGDIGYRAIARES